jgi:hypothetical protein
VALANGLEGLETKGCLKARMPAVARAINRQCAHEMDELGVRVGSLRISR